MIDAGEVARILTGVQRAYLTDRDRFGGRPLQVAQAEAVLAALGGTGGYDPPPPPLPDLLRRVVLLHILAETRARWPSGGWADLVRAACGYTGYPGPSPTQAEFAVMRAVTLEELLTPEPDGAPRVVWPYCPLSHASGRPERLHRMATGWLCGGTAPAGGPCGYETSPAGGELPELAGGV